MRAFTLLTALALPLLSFASPVPAPLPRPGPVSKTVTAAARLHTGRSPIPAPAAHPDPFGVSAGVAIGAALGVGRPGLGVGAKVGAGVGAGAVIGKRGCEFGCGGVSKVPVEEKGKGKDVDGKQESLLKVLVDLKASVDGEVKKLDALAISAYTSATLSPILASIHASIEVAVTKCTALVGKPDTVVLAAVDGSTKVLVTVGQVGNVLARVIVALTTVFAKIVVRVGVSVLAPHFVEIGLALNALVTVCIKLVADLPQVLVPLVQKAVLDMKAFGWVELVATVSAKA